LPHELLLALTVALEDAVVRRDWPEVDALFGERGNILSSVQVMESTEVAAILEADAKLHLRLESERTALQSQLKISRKSNAARRLYSKFG